MRRNLYGAIEWLRRLGSQAYRTITGTLKCTFVRIMYWLSDAYVEVIAFLLAMMCIWMACQWGWG